MDIMATFRQVWAHVREVYESRFCVYERGLQAALYCELRRAFPNRGIVVEPQWHNQGPDKIIPDMVIVTGNEISDIFELKFAPHWMPDDVQNEIQKLLSYQGCENVTLDPLTGQWDQRLPIRPNCRRHFVAVSNLNLWAIPPEEISDQVILWYGRVSEAPEPHHWGVCQGENPN